MGILFIIQLYYYVVILGMDVENKEPVVGFRIGTYLQGKTCVAPIDRVSTIPQRMKDVVNVSFHKNTVFTVYNLIFL